eukprot:477882_1
MMIEYPLHGTEAKKQGNSSVNKSESDDSKQNSNNKELNAFNNKNQHHHRKDDDENEENKNNKNNSSDKSKIGKKYECNIWWHEVKLKQMQRKIEILEQQNPQINKIKMESVSSDEDVDCLIDDVKNNDMKNGVILSRQLRKEMPRRIVQQFSNVIVHLNQYLHIHKDHATKEYKYKENVLKIINYNILCKETHKLLYAVCDKMDNPNNKYPFPLWKTRPNLYTEDQLETLYKISINSLPIGSSLDTTKMFEIKKSMEQIMWILQDDKQRNRIISSKNTPWNREDKIPIFNKSSKNSGLCLILSKEEFVNRVKSFAEINVNNNLILVPIIRFDKKNKYFYEICWIIEIGKNINIAICFKENLKRKSNIPYIPSGIYLDINDQHRLVSYQHDCKCLINFICDIDRLQIGESEQFRTYQSKINKQKCKYENLQKQMNTVMEQREQDMLIVNEMIETYGKLKGDLHSLLQKQTDVEQQQNYCQQLLTLNGVAVQYNPLQQLNPAQILPVNNSLQQLQPQIHQHNDQSEYITH